MATVAIGQVVAIVLIAGWYPETAHLTLEALNPEDAQLDVSEIDPDPDPPASAR